MQLNLVYGAIGIFIICFTRCSAIWQACVNDTYSLKRYENWRDPLEQIPVFVTTETCYTYYAKCSTRVAYLIMFFAFIVILKVIIILYFFLRFLHYLVLLTIFKNNLYARTRIRQNRLPQPVRIIR